VFTQRRELVVFHLDENISDKLLAETFKQYGPLEDVRILPNKQVKQKISCYSELHLDQHLCSE
jgi:hypothetical protein